MIFKHFLRENIVSLCELRLTAQNRNDLDQAINWLRLNGYIQRVGKIKQNNMNQHTINITTTKKDDAAKIVKDRFGTFISVS